jgi:hypothetical protein
MRTTVIALLLASSGVMAQNSNVTATITDPDGQTWNNGTYTISLIPTPGIPGPFTWNGTTNFPQNYVGTIGASGILTITLPDNNAIKPLGTKWQFTLCGNTSAPCQNVRTVVTGASPNLSTTLSSALVAPRFGPGPYAFGYLDAEASGAVLLPGMSYFNVTSNLRRAWNGVAWVNESGSSFTAANDLSGTPSSQTVVGLNGIKFCTGFTPSNGQAIQLTTTSSPNPCWTAAAGGSGTVNSGTINHLAFYNTTGAAVASNGNLVENGTALSYLGSGGVNSTSFTASNLNFGYPASVGPSGLVSNSTVELECDQFMLASYTTQDQGFENCLVANILRGGGTMNARALLASGTLAAQIDFQSAAPWALITPTTGGSLSTTGTYRVVWTYSSLGCGNGVTAGECPGSHESIITLSGSNNAIVVPHPVYPGAASFATSPATCWNVYVSANSGAAWSEVETGTCISLTSNYTITAVGSGSAISKKDLGITVLVPAAPVNSSINQGGVTCSITSTPAVYDQTQDCVMLGMHGTVQGSGTGEGQRWQIQNASSSTSVNALFGSDHNPKNTRSEYQRAEGIGVNCNANGAATVATACMDLEHAPDSDSFRNLDVIAGANMTGLFVNDVNSGSVLDVVHIECSSQTGCIPFKMGATGVNATNVAQGYHGLTGVHPGAGEPSLVWAGTPGSALIDDVYIEGATSDSGTASLFQLGTTGGVGPLAIINASREVGYTNDPRYMIELKAQSATGALISTLYQSVNGALNLIEDDNKPQYNVSCVSATSCGFAGIWTDATGGYAIPSLLGNGASLGVQPGTQGTAGTFTMDMSKGNLQQVTCGNSGGFAITLAVTNNGTANLMPGQELNFMFIQNATNPCTVTFPSTMHGFGTASATLSSCTLQKGIVSNNGSDIYAEAPQNVITTCGGTP